jgi:hypothetical protein
LKRHANGKRLDAHVSLPAFTNMWFRSSAGRSAAIRRAFGQKMPLVHCRCGIFAVRRAGPVFVEKNCNISSIDR